MAFVDDDFLNQQQGQPQGGPPIPAPPPQAQPQTAPAAPPPPGSTAPPPGATPGSWTESSGAVVSQQAQQYSNTINSNISAAQYQTWINQGLDLGNGMWKSAKLCNGSPCPPVKDSPDNCPDGWYAHGARDCRQGDPNTAGGPGGGQGGPGAPGGVPGLPGGGLGGLGSIDEFLRTGILNNPSRYTPEVMGRLKAAFRQRAGRTTAQQTAAAKADAASRGLLRSGNQSARFDAIRRGAESDVTGQLAELETQKINADFQDKSAALDRAQKYLDQSRDFALRSDMNAAQKQQFSANLAFAYAGLQHQWDILRAQAGYNALSGSV